MPRNSELARPKSEQEEAFRRKQAAWVAYDEVRQRADDAYSAMQQAWEERSLARDRMNQEYEAMEASSDRYREVWDEYGRIRDCNNSRIESLRYEADREHQEMQRCFEQASSEYEYGDKSMAPVYAEEGREHKARRDELNAEVADLCREVKEAKRNAEWRAPKTDSSGYKAARGEFQRLKERHESLRADFGRLKTERQRLKEEFDALQREFKIRTAEFQSKLEEVKAERQRERDKALDKAGVSWLDRKDAKVVKKADGTTQVYSGGLGKGDGVGHGHVALDSSGEKTYDRPAFAAHGKQNAVEKRPGGWSEYQRGVVGDSDHEVTFRQGWGSKEGQTMIADGHITKSEFKAGHNHYGDNDKSLYPDEADRIEDSRAHKNDKFYTGPDH